MNAHNTHTPGPWTLGDHHRIESPTPGGGCVLIVSERKISGQTGEQQAANARLIAAAPAMLEALHGLKKCAAITAERLDIDSSAAIWAWISEAQDALMQATGGADQ